MPTASERGELMALSRVVIDGDLCGMLFPEFIRGFQDDTGHEPSGVVKRIASEIRQAEANHHLSPTDVSAMLQRAAEAD